MKKLNRKFIKGANWALAGLMSLLGFSSCGEIGGCAGKDDIQAEYGTPYAEFIVSGKVTDSDNRGKVTDSDNRGLQGISVIVSKADHHQRATSGFIPDQNVITQEIQDTSYTKENGNFEYSYNGFPTNDSINIHIKFEDLSDNVRYEADSAKVTFFSSELKGGNGWYEGKA
ncbi:MAG: radical SAM-associated putative lipoprotein, partial [Tannerella sp.]|nr:radical SAM-associated putative lipoprotein [Tannerella sp.]